MLTSSIIIPLLAIIAGALIIFLGLLILNLCMPKKIKLNTATEAENASIAEILEEEDVSNTKYGHFYKKTLRPYFKKNPGTMDRLIQSLKLDREELQNQINNANMNRQITVEEFASMQLLGLAAFFIFLIVSALTFQPGLFFIGFFIFALGAWLPKQIIMSKVKTKRDSIEMELPEFLELVKMSAESGLNIQDSLNKVAMRIDSPLANEFKSVMAESKAIGGDWRTAVHNMLRRNNIDVLTDIMSDIMIATDKGTPIAETLGKDIALMRKLKINKINEMAKKNVTTQLLVMMVFDVIPLFILLLLPPAIIIIGGGL